MRKTVFIVVILLLAAFALFACTEADAGSFGSNNVTYPEVSGALGEFSALAPTVGYETLTVPTFSWEASANAEYYELEVTTGEFTDDDTSYFKKSGIITTEYNIGAALKIKDTTYYWRVTAIGNSRKKICKQEVMNFYYKANVQEQIEMDVIHTDEWTRHKDGSVASVAVDKKDFFGTGSDSLVITFVEEDTNQGEGYEMSDGWVVFTHSEDIELYGVDAFYFNFYYAGDDAEVYFRVVDEDNEYWEAPIKLANNAKQTIIIHKDEFNLHTKDTTIANRKFDFHNLKSFEIVFEHSFGDGIAYFSDLRVITYEKYAPLFISSLDFNDYKAGIKYENYNFGTEVSEDGSALTYSFSGTANENNAKGIQGYGFVKMPLTTQQAVQDQLEVNVNGVILSRGDAFKMKVKLNDNHLSGSHTICIRLIEEDGDRWSYQQPVSSLPEDGILLIPYTAFTMSEFGGDGFRQFYGIKEMQFGVINNVYTTSRITISDVSVVSIAAELAKEEKVMYHADVKEDGMIEDFEGYGNSVEMYYTWEMSSTNKDEAMALDSTNALGMKNSCGMFYYKTNMGEAEYFISIDAIEDNPYNAVEFYAKDFSVKKVQKDDGSWENVTVQAKVVVYLMTDNGVVYSFPQQELGEPTVYLAGSNGVSAVTDEWRYYKIPFSAFSRLPDYKKGSATVDPDHIVKIGFGISDKVNHFHNDKDYVTGSAVAFDNIRFIVAEKAVFDTLETKLKPSSGNPNLTVVDDFDSNILRWEPKAGQESWVNPELTNEVTASGSGYSLALPYKSGMDATYSSTIFVDESVEAQGIRFLMKATQASDIMPQVSFVIYLKDGTKYQYDLQDGEGTKTPVSSEWTYYTIGLNKFTKDNAGTQAFNIGDVANISQITLALKRYNVDLWRSGKLYIDEIVLDKTIALDANTSTPYAA